MDESILIPTKILETLAVPEELIEILKLYEGDCVTLKSNSIEGYTLKIGFTLTKKESDNGKEIAL